MRGLDNTPSLLYYIHFVKYLTFYEMFTFPNNIWCYVTTKYENILMTDLDDIPLRETTKNKTFVLLNPNGGTVLNLRTVVDK